MAGEATLAAVLVDAWLPRAAAARPGHPAVGALTFRELLADASAGARRLAAQGVGAGHPVALRLPAGDAFAVALHACWLLGAVPSPHGHVVDEPLAGAEADAPLRTQHDLDATALVVRTSGTSSGRPKDVPLTFGNLLWSAQGAAVALGRRADDRWLCCLPLTHVGGLSILSRSVVWQTSAEVHERFDTARVLAALERATLVSLVPTTLRRLLDAGLERPPRLRAVVLGGAAADPALVARARERGLPVVTTYGMTETASMVVVDGRPVPFARVRADGEELVVRGPMVAGGEHRTGDRGHVAPDGSVTVLGRLDDVIITGGENVAPDGVEAVLAAHPAVAEAAVFGRPNPEWGQAVVAAIVPRGEDPDPSELRAWCAARLARHEVPKAFEMRRELPRNAAGKVLRRRLRDVPAASAERERQVIDHEAYRAESRAKWEQQAVGWEARREPFARDTRPVTQALLDVLALRPGETVLEVAAGTGDVGLQALERVRPGGRVILTDGAEAMVAAMRRAAADAPDVEVRAMEAEWLDLPAASVDAVVCRWGYMLLADPEAALRDARRVVRPGGRLALAVWARADDNPWLESLGRVMVARGHWEADPPGMPGPFALPDPEVLSELLETAGFADPQVRTVDFAFHAASPDEWWEHLRQTSGRLPTTLRALPPAEHARVRDDLDAALAPYTRDDGSLELPARTLVARADA